MHLRPDLAHKATKHGKLKVTVPPTRIGMKRYLTQSLALVDVWVLRFCYLDCNLPGRWN
jgi:hypothetical protein